MTAADLAVHYQRIARGIAAQLYRDGVVRNAPCVWGAVTDALIAAHAAGTQEACANPMMEPGRDEPERTAGWKR